MNTIKTFRNIIFTILLVPIFIFGIFTVYSHLSKDISVTYFDEVWWVWDSAIIQNLIPPDFNNEVWQIPANIDQPTLTKFVFGLWIYPKYLNERNGLGVKDYKKYLLLNGYFYPDGIYQSHTVTESKSYPEYGMQLNPNLIFYVRKLNFLFLAGSALIIFWFFWKQKGLWFSLALTFFYAFNSLVVTTGIKAHSEALFLILFNSSLIAMILYFLKKQKALYLICFSILAGLCFSTKLNGIMLYFIYLVLSVFVIPPNLISKNLFKKLTALIMPLLIVLVVFTFLNPYVYPDPLRRIWEMVQYRFDLSHRQAVNFTADIPLGFRSTLKQIFENFFVNKNVLGFNNLVFNKNYNSFGLALFIFFTLGLISEIGEIKKGNKLAKILLISFISTLLITASYITINWPRYYIHLVLFFIYYQISGFISFLRIWKGIILENVTNYFKNENNENTY